MEVITTSEVVDIGSMCQLIVGTQYSVTSLLTSSTLRFYPARVKGLSNSATLLRFTKAGEWYEVEIGIDGIRAVPFEVPTPTIISLAEKGEVSLGEYLERQAINLISRYGDARDPRPDPALLDANAA